jgi:hypothetical protein
MIFLAAGFVETAQSCSKLLTISSLNSELMSHQAWFHFGFLHEKSYNPDESNTAFAFVNTAFAEFRQVRPASASWSQQ